jgi:hypothetical protein
MGGSPVALHSPERIINRFIYSRIVAEHSHRNRRAQDCSCLLCVLRARAKTNSQVG